MSDKPLRYPTVLFDWGDTVMRDDPANTAPMVEWETVEIVEGIADVLDYLYTSGRRIVLATSANISDETQIWAALRRGGLDRYFSHIYCFKNTNLPKGEAFYRFILNDLNIPASEAMMVGDHFEKDILNPNSLGIFAVWFNPRSNEDNSDELHITIHTLPELIKFFESRDNRLTDVS
jgi:putative hydrolase of the HAD superfamily